MKVLFITRKWPPAVGGMELYCRELVNELKTRVSLDVRALPGRKNGSPPSIWSMYVFGLRTAISLLLRRTDSDVVHGGDLAVWPLVWLARLRNRNIRPILSAHGTDIAFAYRRGLLSGLYWAYLKLARWLLPSVVIIANSSATKTLCIGIAFKSVQVVRLGARIATGGGGAPDPFLLFAGRLIPRKGCAWFIHNVLPKVDARFRLVVAGTIGNKGEEEALSNDRVEFRGPVTGDDLSRLRQRATVVVVPNVDMGINGFEGFGLSAVEGAAAGCVVLASRVDGVCDAILDGVTGFLLPAGNAIAWSEKISEITGWAPDHRRAFLSRSRQTVDEIFSWSHVVDETIAAYHGKGIGSAWSTPSTPNSERD